MLIFANPSTRPARRRSKTKGPKMAKRKATRRRVSRRVTKNPGTPRRRRRSYTMKARPVHRRRRVHRNPSFAKGILGELASMNGVLLIGSAVVAPTVTNMVADAILPAQYNAGYPRLAAKAAIVAAAAWAIDRFAKSRHAALGFAIGGLGTVVNEAVNVIRARQELPATVEPAAADEIARNPAAFESLMSGRWNSLNGYEPAPVGGYDMAPVGNLREVSGEYESLN